MSTLYLRNVPDELVARLRRLAELQSTSVAAVAVRELDESTRRVDNPALLSAPPHLDVPSSTGADRLDDERSSR